MYLKKNVSKMAFLSVIFVALGGCGSDYSEKMSIEKTGDVDFSVTKAFFYKNSEDLLKAANQIDQDLKKLNALSISVKGESLALVEPLSILPESPEKTTLVELAKSAEDAYKEAFVKWDKEYLPAKIKEQQEKIDSLKTKLKSAEEYVAKYDQEIEVQKSSVDSTQAKIDESNSALNTIREDVKNFFNETIISERLPYKKIDRPFSSRFNMYSSFSENKCNEKTRKGWGGYQLSVMNNGTCYVFSSLPKEEVIQAINLNALKAKFVKYAETYEVYSSNADSLKQAQKALKDQKIIAGNLYPDYKSKKYELDRGNSDLSHLNKYLKDLNGQQGKPSSGYLLNVDAIKKFQTEYRKMKRDGTIMATLVKGFNDEYLVGTVTFDSNTYQANTIEDAGAMVLVKVSDKTNQKARNLFFMDNVTVKEINAYYLDLLAENPLLSENDVFNVEDNSKLIESESFKERAWDNIDSKNKEALIDMMSIHALQKST
ncbi:hypothetical protein J3998_07870 [Thiomicrorhabdus sp. 6S2-11]|uniref:Uncharacterized protein n=1 Tax=Thiomicrorhabdus marina TaxID=2818442 RepID=A0ABS3Q581_9GAMM|nr:hypothetical protein [Thiomicrorhabdus marina]MBO1927493.1 hypothetical protein [Thiomicrorhabdus marina]